MPLIFSSVNLQIFNNYNTLLLLTIFQKWKMIGTLVHTEEKEILVTTIKAQFELSSGVLKSC